ncbi:MAG: hypoxanthine phosphoribosyltransferase [Bdellovibrionales bacterium]|nr:hypoxanthine phosphoribosyltransferase [Bdellovibrionales bacterium]
MNQKPEVYLSKELIRQRVSELGDQITRDFAGNHLICVGVLKGSFIFFADLVRQIDLPLKIDFLRASSYGDHTESSGVVKITLDLSLSIENQHVLLIEDIVDTGTTIHYLLKNLKLRNPASLKFCSLLFKPTQVKNQVPIDYLGFEIDDQFVVGYGLDMAENYRNLPYLGKINPRG